MYSIRSRGDLRFVYIEQTDKYMDEPSLLESLVVQV